MRISWLLELFTLAVLDIVSCSPIKSIDMNSLNMDSIVFYIGNNEINYKRDGINKIKELNGLPLTSKKIGGNEIGKIGLDSYAGIDVEYYLGNGVLRRITISSKKYSILGGINVGAEKNATENILKNGKYIESDNSYFFAYFPGGGESAIGYIIYYDKKNVIEKINISEFALSP
jgi:hypothetical protein